MAEPPEDKQLWLDVLKWLGWSALWLFVATGLLMCIFGCLLYNWRG